jgi:hypothetical protein
MKLSTLLKATRVLVTKGPKELLRKVEERNLVEKRKKRLVGLLYDSVFQNTGDKAIGLVMSDFLRENKTPFEIINPLSFDPLRYKRLIVGGGELIRDKGDSYYDLFRVNGNHILNTVGLTTNQDLGYLKGYSYLSVRSKASRKNVPSGVRNVKIVPDVTLKLVPEKYENFYSKRLIGIHVMGNVFEKYTHLIGLLSSIEDHQKVFLPVTFYNEDYKVMANTSKVTGIDTLPLLNPRQILYFISTLKFLISSSLHATIFAYKNNVPFLAMWQPKIEYFLKDRGLENHIFHDEEELKEKLPKFLKMKFDFSEKIKSDEKILDEHFYTIKQLL